MDVYDSGFADMSEVKVDAIMKALHYQMNVEVSVLGSKGEVLQVLEANYEAIYGAVNEIQSRSYS
jgi:hypothetical protein